jgi:hypothetical protein
MVNIIPKRPKRNYVKRAQDINTATKHDKKISDNRKGKYTGLANHNFGKELPDDTKQKISDNRKGKCVGSENPFYGKTHTETTLAPIREKCRARMAYIREVYYEYKTLGGPLKWNDFRKAV